MSAWTCRCGNCWSSQTHPIDMCWLSTRDMVNCGCCHVGFHKGYMPDLYQAVLEKYPKKHCWRWKIGDPRDKHHALKCIVGMQLGRILKEAEA